MAKSRIETELAETDLKEFRRLLATGRLTIDALTLWLEGRGYQISRSAVGRYTKDYEDVAARLRESRSMAEVIVQEIGPNAVDGKQGRMLVEIFRTLVNDHFMKVMRGEESGLGPQEFMFLAKALKDSSGAARLDQDFELKVRELAAKMAADAVDEEAKVNRGLTAETVGKLKARFLGMKAA